MPWRAVTALHDMDDVVHVSRPTPIFLHMMLHALPGMPGALGMPGPMFGIIGSPSGVSSSPGARSWMMSAGGCPHSCRSCISSMRRGKLSGSVSYTITSFWNAWYILP